MTAVDSGGLIAALTRPNDTVVRVPPATPPSLMTPHSIPPSNNVPNPRNAGRKKSNPVWEFFTDLRSYGLAGVRCRFCHWLTNDRSPTTMKFHLKRKHDTGPGGLWALCEEKIGQQSPPVYSRKRPSNDPTDMLRRSVMQNVMTSVHEQMLSSLFTQASNGKNDSLSSLLAASPLNNNGVEESVTPITDLIMPKLEEPDTPDEAISLSSLPTSLFSLSDGIASLVQIANEADLVFTFNSRRNGEFCFESNEEGKKGHLVTFADGVSELMVVYSINGEEKTKECWKKSDWPQFQWAVRGAITHFLK